jgi:ferredoxin
MGHLVNPARTYQLLQKRLDQNVTGAPDSPAFQKILRILFSEEDAEIARQIPTRLTPAHRLAPRLGREEAWLTDKLSDMSRRGLVFDIEHSGRHYYSLSPVVIGFFEFTFMRTGDDLPRAELARLFEEYFFDGGGEFARAVFGGETQIGRSLVRESALPDEDVAEILDWERSTRLIETASTVAVSTCACRHHSEHLGKSCNRPQRVCLTLNDGAETMVRSGHAERISAREGLAIIEESQKAGLAQTGDNVKKNVGYICNCCGCCCGMMRSIRSFDLNHAIVSSNWIAEVDAAECTGCGLCVKACPTGAMANEDYVLDGRKRRRAVREEDLCLGCGVCDTACKMNAISMRPRERRVFTPETTFDRIVAMAIERGKLADLLLEDPENLSSQALGRVLKVLQGLVPAQAVKALAPLRSTFIETFLPLARPFGGRSAQIV